MVELKLSYYYCRIPIELIVILDHERVQAWHQWTSVFWRVACAGTHQGAPRGGHPAICGGRAAHVVDAWLCMCICELWRWLPKIDWSQQSSRISFFLFFYRRGYYNSSGYHMIVVVGLDVGARHASYSYYYQWQLMDSMYVLVTSLKYKMICETFK